MFVTLCPIRVNFTFMDRYTPQDPTTLRRTCPIWKHWRVTSSFATPTNSYCGTRVKVQDLPQARPTVGKSLGNMEQNWRHWQQEQDWGQEQHQDKRILDT